jgi:tetratricopeptide (TPR) repeat protein
MADPIVPLRVGVAEVEIGGGLADGAVELTLTVSGSTVALHGAGVDVSAPHAGVGDGLRAAVNDVRRERARAGHRRDPAVPTQRRDGSVSLRRAGELMAESFLPEPVAAALADVLRRAAAGHVPVRLGVCAPGHPWLPWETLPDPVERRPLALHPLVTVYRKVTAPRVRQIPGPLRIVVAIAAPEAGGGAVLDHERELRNVLAAVRGARQGDADVRVVPFATTAAIRSALDEAPAHVLHLSGHAGPGTLVLEDASGAARTVPADEFVDEAIPPGLMPPVVCLAACSTDVPAEPGSTSFAGRLIERGASAVIGTETSVTDRYATAVFARVYQELSEAAVPDVVASVADARRVVQLQWATSTHPREAELAGLDEWGVLTVLAGAGSVRVFDPAVTAEVPARDVGSVPGLLTREVGEFVGRRRELRRLPGELFGPEVSGLVLHGIGGVGKTTLAAELVRRAEPRAVAVLTGALSVDTLLARVAEAIRRTVNPAGAAMRAVEFATHVDESCQDRLAALHRHVLGQVPVLAVLDNFEDNLTDDPADRRVRDQSLAALLALWAADPGRSRLLVTSRYEFALPDDAETHLRSVPVGPLSLAETLKLIWALPALDRLDDAEVERVWRLVGGHPRTLEYVDALLRGGRARFHDVTARLTRAVRAKLGRHAGDRVLRAARTLDAALAEAVTLAADDVLLDELVGSLADTPDAERLLLGASVYREPVDHNALLFHLGGPDDSAGALPGRHSARPPRSAPPGLARTVDRVAATTLLAVDHDTDTVFVHRWTAAELERRWREQGRVDELREAHRRAAEYWRWRVDRLPQDLDANVHDLLEGRHHLLELGDVEGAGELTRYACSRLLTVGAWDRSAELVHDMLGRLADDSPDRAFWLHLLGVLAQKRGDYAEAHRRYTQALAIDEPLDNQTGIATTYHNLGVLAHDRGDNAEAHRCYTHALAIAERLVNEPDIAAAYHNLGVLAQDRGDYPEAERYYTQALAINEKIDDQARMAAAHHNLGVLARDRGDYAEAERYYTHALSLKEELDDRAGIANTYRELGKLVHDRGDYAEAERYYTGALTINEELGNQAGIATCYGQLGILAHDRGDYAEARRRYTQALAIDEQLGNRTGIATDWGQLGRLAEDQQQYGKAVAWHLSALLARLELRTPSAIHNAHALCRFRERLGPELFVDAAKEVVDEQTLDSVLELLDSVTDEDD